MRRHVLVWASLASMASGACGGASESRPAPVDPAARAKDAARLIDEGATKRAMAVLGPDPTPTDDETIAALRIIALLELREWGRAERFMSPITRSEAKTKAALECLFAAERRDVTAERTCRKARESELGKAQDTLGDAVARGLAKALEADHRLEECEATLRELVKTRPTTANRRSLVAYFERQGFVREAVELLEAWRAAEPTDKSLDDKLAMALDRKVRGDLLDKRGADAEAAARKLLALKPQRQEIRYFLADALEMNGNKAGAEAERAAAKAAGAVAPLPVDAVPGQAPDATAPKPSEPPAPKPDAHDPK